MKSKNTRKYNLANIQYDYFSKQYIGKLDHPDNIDTNKLISIGPRGFGKVDENGHISDYKIISYDLVLSPSFKNSKFKKQNIFTKLKNKIYELYVKIFQRS